MQTKHAGLIAAVLAFLGIGVATMGDSSRTAPSGQVEAPGIAGKIVTLASLAEDWTYGDDATRERYIARCYPGDKDANGNPDANARSMGSAQDSCLLFARGTLAAAGVDGGITYKGTSVDILRAPYAKYIGEIEGMIQTFARQKDIFVGNAWSQRELVVSPGDIVLIGMGGSVPSDPTEKEKWLSFWGGVAHGGVVVEINGDSIVSVDGGQPDPRTGKNTAIRKRVRKLTNRGGAWWLDNRRLNYIIRSSQLSR